MVLESPQHPSHPVQHRAMVYCDVWVRILVACVVGSHAVVVVVVVVRSIRVVIGENQAATKLNYNHLSR